MVIYMVILKYFCISLVGKILGVLPPAPCSYGHGLWCHGPCRHLRSPRLLCVRSLGSPWYDYVYFNSASSGIQ